MGSHEPRTDDDGPYCPVFHNTIELLGRRWNGVIIGALRNGVNRFGDIKDTIPGLSSRLLSERLRELECEGLIIRTEDHGQVRYELTQAGDELTPVVEAINMWAQRWGHPISE